MNKKLVAAIAGVVVIALAGGLLWSQSSDDPATEAPTTVVPDTDGVETDDATDDEVESARAGDGQDAGAVGTDDTSDATTSAVTSGTTVGAEGGDGTQAAQRSDPRSRLCPPRAGYGDKPKKGCKPSS